MKTTRLDLILIAVIVAVAVLVGGLLLLLAPRGMTATVTLGGEEVARLPLDSDATLTVDTGHTIVVKDGTVTVESAPCPDQICARHLPISREGETVVCLPYQLVVTVTRGGEP